MEITFRVDFGLISGIYVGLILFGLGFNKLTAWIEHRGYIEGFTSLLVALGCFVTIAPFALVSPFAALGILGGFAASGSPMIIGSIVRYIQRRERARLEIARLKYGDCTQGLAE